MRLGGSLGEPKRFWSGRELEKKVITSVNEGTTNWGSDEVARNFGKFSRGRNVTKSIPEKVFLGFFYRGESGQQRFWGGNLSRGSCFSSKG